MRTCVVLAGLCVAVASLSSCEEEAVVTCDCPLTTPACDICPPLMTGTCADDECVALDAADADVVADISIQRGLDGVVALSIGIVDASSVSCATVGLLTESDAVLDGRRLDVPGGPFHPDIAFGSAPAGHVLVVADAYDADTAVVGQGCLDVTVSAGSNTLDPLIVTP